MSRAHCHSFPKDTPEPLAQPFTAACAFIDRVLRWTLIATGWTATLLAVWLVLAVSNR